MIRATGHPLIAGLVRTVSRPGLSTVLGVSTLWVMTLGSAPGVAQTGDSLVVLGPDDSSFSVPVAMSSGYATVPHEVLRELGWAVELDEGALRAITYMVLCNFWPVYRARQHDCY